MPRYYFDTHNGDELVTDEIGLILSTEKEARDEAIRALPEMAREELPDGPEHCFWVKIRDERGEYIFQASLKLKSDWLNARR